MIYQLIGSKFNRCENKALKMAYLAHCMILNPVNALSGESAVEVERGLLKKVEVPLNIRPVDER